jgi:acetyltransferase-like isoleucine patch superfamily enzyme
VREGAVVGRDSSLGRFTAIGRHVILGERVRIQNSCLFAPHVVVEDEVTLAGNIVITEDETVGRHGPGYVKPTTVLRRRCRIGASVTLLPGLEIGEEAFVGAGSLVTRDVPARTLVMGSPARLVRGLSDEELAGGE